MITETERVSSIPDDPWRTVARQTIAIVALAVWGIALLWAWAPQAHGQMLDPDQGKEAVELGCDTAFCLPQTIECPEGLPQAWWTDHGAGLHIMRTDKGTARTVSPIYTFLHGETVTILSIMREDGTMETLLGSRCWVDSPATEAEAPTTTSEAQEGAQEPQEAATLIPAVSVARGPGEAAPGLPGATRTELAATGPGDVVKPALVTAAVLILLGVAILAGIGLAEAAGRVVARNDQQR